MDLFEATNYYLAERNPHLASYTTTRDVAKNYRGHMYSIRFVQSWGKDSVNKVGINPTKKWNNPRGVYSYWIDDYNRGINGSFAGNYDVAYIIKRKLFGKQIEDIGELYKKEYDYYLPLLEKFYNEDDECQAVRKDYGDFNNFMTSVKDRSNNKTFGGILFYAVIMIGEKSQNRENDVFQTYVWRNILGVTFIGDKGHGIIHPNEAGQCLFLDPRAYEVVEKINNLKKYAVIKNKVDTNDLAKKLSAVYRDEYLKKEEKKIRPFMNAVSNHDNAEQEILEFRKREFGPPSADKIIKIMDAYFKHGAGENIKSFISFWDEDISKHLFRTVGSFTIHGNRYLTDEEFDKYRKHVQKIYNYLKTKFDVPEWIGQYWMFDKDLSTLPDNAYDDFVKGF